MRKLLLLTVLPGCFSTSVKVTETSEVPLGVFLIPTLVLLVLVAIVGRGK